MTLSPRALEERNLPAIWDDGYNPDRVDWYTRLVVEHGQVKGGAMVVAEFISAMLLESGLDNLELGNNARHGSNNPYVGTGWCQLDTGYHATTIEKFHSIRFDPIFSLEYILSTPDLSYQGTQKTWFNKERWHAWDKDLIDPTDEGTWSPLKAALEAYERVTAV